MTAPKQGSRSPWGSIQTVETIAEGIYRVHTAGHGGLKLSRARQAKIPTYMRLNGNGEGGYYEEDCEWSIVATVFPECFNESQQKSAKDQLKNYYPEIYETFYQVKLAAGESHSRDAESFAVRHANDYVAVAAWGDWHEKVPQGMVGVCASLGGSREIGREVAYFLVPHDEYQARGKFGFVIDTDRHQTWKDHA